jgi:hypothetical protein
MFRIALLALALVAGCGRTDPDRRQDMPTKVTVDQAAAALRAIGDDALLASNEKDLKRQALKALSKKQVDGLVLRAPARLDVAEHAKLPALVVNEQSDEHANQVPLAKNAVIVITRLGAGGCWLAHPYATPHHKNPMKDDPRNRPDPPAEDAEDARGTGARLVDARAQGMPWTPGRFSLRVISADWVSNAETVTLVGKESPAAPQKVKLAAGATFTKGDSLATEGVALKLSSNVAHGTLKLKKDAGWPVTEDGRPAIPFVILLKRPGILNPVVMELHAPASDEGEAWFTVELKQAEKGWVYLIAGEHMSGPHEIR